MLILSAILFATSSVAFLGHEPRGATLFGGLLSAAAFIAASVRVFGWLQGLVVAFVLAMTAASALVFILPPRRSLPLPLALASASLGVVAGVFGLATGGAP